jgi:hypothetical protein
VILLVVPLLWTVLWALLAIVICGALGIPPHSPHLWWTMGGIFVGGGIVLPAIAIAAWSRIRKNRPR